MFPNKIAEETSSLTKINDSSKNLSSYFTNSATEDIENVVPLSTCSEHIVLYIAGFVAYKLKKTLKCCLCIAAVLANEDEISTFENSLISYKTKGYISYPSQDVLKI